MKLKEKLRQNLTGQLSDEKTEVDVNIAEKIAEEFAMEFALFLNDNIYENYYQDLDKDGKTWVTYYEEGFDDYSTANRLTIQEVLEIFKKHCVKVNNEVVM